MKPVLLVTATRCKTIDEFKERPLYESLHILCEKRYTNTQFDFKIVTDNTRGLSEVYNDFIIENNKNKIVLFIHDDVEIHDLMLAEKLNQSPWDITGLAGGSNFRIAEQNLWHLCTEKNTHSGFVSHPVVKFENNQIKKVSNQYSVTNFGPTPKRCLVVDGLFIAVNVETALNVDFKFDTRHKFHHYDLASCLLANDKKLKVGTYPINVVHHGVGDSYMSDEWRNSNQEFLKNWK